MGCCMEKNERKEIGEVSQSKWEKLKTKIDKYKEIPGSLISVLQEAQEIYGYLPKEILQQIGESMGIKPAKIHGVATFYTQFRLEPVGKYLISLCQGTACHVNGSKLIEEVIRSELNVDAGGTTKDQLFTLHNVACLGCCSLSPVMMINGETYGKLTPDMARMIIREIMTSEQKGV
ncbi:MAG: NAD(P)H-dependent oxidoreductase subunit [Anaerosolibacter sp.]|uniref:NADH-quinone oxidoreductase subunit NuoE n=1 Tax=Anaerosolibacter sp. TaxID=1872527 RepID=UPI00261E17CD|nr:NADH-quinone oxidoreductase subunit NuoE [Anaerosolibacter sp.]MDF2548213.1 NAD(P)H-dependent oxidoreductase subunit [Anaerosolibacter sp.]